jgi:sigma-B regulation protein RsbU (phosphoserine phosphatase)
MAASEHDRTNPAQGEHGEVLVRLQPAGRRFGTRGTLRAQQRDRTSAPMKVLIVDATDQALPDGTAELVRSIGWVPITVPSYHDAVEAAGTGSFDAVIVTAPERPAAAGDPGTDFHALLRVVDARRIAGIMIGAPPACGPRGPESLIDTVGPGITLPELRGRLAMIERYHAVMEQLEHELSNMQRLGKRLDRHFREVDQEMRLAGRLQRDFLPDLHAPIENAQFAAVYRPASWVSGDMFDVFRVDEDHTGFYLADAVGHGMAAGLLTMFIKRAIVPKRVDDEGYAVLNAGNVITGLNDALAEQSLPNCQFVTACYGLLNHRTCTLQYARGGHPYPVLITSDGLVSDLKTPGGLLGIFKGEEFPDFEIRLRVGDKVLLYTDGIEHVFQRSESSSPDGRTYHHTLRRLASLPIQEMMAQIEMQLDREVGSLDPQDDVTIVGLEII